MIGGKVFTLLEVQTVDPVGGIEHAVDLYAVDVEIRLHLVLRQIELCLLHLGRVVETVVGLEVEVRALGLTGVSLDGGCLFVSVGAVSLDEVVQESIDVIRSLGHRFLQRVSSIIGITHDLALFGSEFCHLHDNGQCVVFTCTVAAMDGSLIDAAA